MKTITVRIIRDGDWYVSHCLDYDIVSQGQTRQEAKDNIIEAVSLFLECASNEEIQRCLDENGRLEQLSFNSAEAKETVRPGSM